MSFFLFHPDADKPDFVKSEHLITSLSVSRNDRHWTITVFTRGANAGRLVVDAEDGPSFVNRLLPGGMRAESYAIMMTAEKLYFTGSLDPAGNGWSDRERDALLFARYNDAFVMNKEYDFIGTSIVTIVQKLDLPPEEEAPSPNVQQYFLDSAHCEICAPQSLRLQFRRCADHFQTPHPFTLT